MHAHQNRVIRRAPAAIGSAIAAAIAVVISAYLVLASAPASAAPATVKVFEGTARERPEAAAPVLKTFPENTELSVSEEVTDGWRRVRLPDGGVGYVRDQELALELAGAAPPTAKLVVRQRPDEEHHSPALLYIKDLPHLAEVVSRDDQVHQMATALTTRRTAAIGVGAGSLLVGALLIAGAMTVFAHASCDVFSTGGGPNGPTTSEFCTDLTNQPMLFAGTGVLLAGGLAGVWLWPKRDDVLDVINAWNRRHIDNPITVDRSVATHDQ